MEPRLLLLAVVLATTVSSQADLKEDATEYGEKLAKDLFEHGEKDQEAIYTRKVTGVNMYGYHSQNDIDSFVEIANHVAAAKGENLRRELKALEDKNLLMKAVWLFMLPLMSNQKPDTLWRRNSNEESMRESSEAPVVTTSSLDGDPKLKATWNDAWDQIDVESSQSAVPEAPEPPPAVEEPKQGAGPSGRTGACACHETP